MNLHSIDRTELELQDCLGRACRTDENAVERVDDESQGVKGDIPHANFVVAINSRLIFATVSTYPTVEDCSIVFKRGNTTTLYNIFGGQGPAAENKFVGHRK